MTASDDLAAAMKTALDEYSDRSYGELYLEPHTDDVADIALAAITEHLWWEYGLERGWVDPMHGRQGFYRRSGEAE